MLNNAMDYDPKKFDAYADDYEALHAQSVSASGEPMDYFYTYKINCLHRLGMKERDRVLDYGCGTGNMVARLADVHCDVHGYDPSEASVDACRARVPGAALYVNPLDIPESSFDWAIMSGVLHHISPEQRLENVQNVFRSLRPGGFLVVFEHNPINPLTRRVVERCPFDDDAILLSAGEIASLLVHAGFESIRRDYIVFFPRILSVFRVFEPSLRWCPLGAQTMTIGKREMG